MELGIGSIVYEFAGLTLNQAAERIAANGLHFVDVLAFGDYNPAFYPIQEQERIADTFRRFDLRASSVVTCAHGNIASDDEKERAFALEQLKRAAMLVKRLGGRQVLVGKGCGNIDFDLPRERAFDTAAAFLRGYAKWCRDQGLLVTMELEPEALHVLNGIEAMKAMIEAVGEENVLANIDVGHLNILREPPEALSRLRGRMIHMHLSENYGLAHTNSVIGEGNVNFAAYVGKAIEYGIEETAARHGDVAVAAIEVGEPGEYIADCDWRVLKSVGHVYSVVPQLRKPYQ